MSKIYRHGELLKQDGLKNDFRSVADAEKAIAEMIANARAQLVLVMGETWIKKRESSLHAGWETREDT